MTQILREQNFRYPKSEEERWKETFYKGMSWQDKGEQLQSDRNKVGLDVRKKFLAGRVVRHW